MPSSNSGGGAASDDGSSAGSGSGGGGGGGGALKKGPWTAAEDAILMEYVKKHGEGNWNAVQKNSGLSRCGKSCRLRWANHLRPNLKKGSFSPDEERLILELHSKLGNKWARMAAQLPGRTDNEIKNYWNTRVKRRQRSGLPLYPQGIGIQRQQVYHHNQHQQQHQNSSSQSPLSISTLHHHQKPSFGSKLFDPMSFSSTSAGNLLNHHNQNQHRHNVPHHQHQHQSLPSHFNGYKRFRGGGGNVDGFTHQISPPNASIPLLNQSFSRQLLPPMSSSSSPSLQFNSGSFAINQPMIRPHFEHDSVVPLHSSVFPMKMELPSSQMPQPSSAASASASAAVADDGLMAPQLVRSNSGLLDALLHQAEAMGGEGGRDDRGGRGKDRLDGFLSSTTHPLGSAAAHWDDSVHSSMGVKMKKEAQEEINSVEDDELSSLLETIPSDMLVLDLCSEGGEISNGQSSIVTDDDMGVLDLHHRLPSSLSTNTTTTAAATTTTSAALDHDWTVDAWNNMPDMC
ncbi:hypothetical protein Scep_012907 [Stephania cephalantha]|uniref:Uncharacterized protein n=1 Tax=Stephania cephalantha TaxID=152367 RepID=A0AAP0JFZ2_9MAGN